MTAMTSFFRHAASTPRDHPSSAPPRRAGKLHRDDDSSNRYDRGVDDAGERELVRLPKAVPVLVLRESERI
jgi:hypothetical protein